MQDFTHLLQSRQYDPSQELPPENIVLTIENKTIATLQNIVTITGLPKQGKSRYIGAIAAAALTRSEIFGIRCRLPENRPKVAYFDTEQGSHEFIKSMKFIETLAGGINSNFFAYSTREDYPKVQLNLIDTFLKLHSDCSLLFLDGILDLLDSFNDERESVRLTRLLKKWSKVNDMIIINVLHRKKDGSNTLGQIGSSIDRASQSVLIVEKNKERNTYILKPEFLRSADEFTPVEIYYNKQAEQWQQTWTDEEDKKVARLKKLSPQELLIEEHRQLVFRIFNVECPQTYDRLRENVKEFYMCGKTYAEQVIKHLYSENLIWKTADGYTNVRTQQLFAKK